MNKNYNNSNNYCILIYTFCLSSVSVSSLKKSCKLASKSLKNDVFYENNISEKLYILNETK